MLVLSAAVLVIVIDCGVLDLELILGKPVGRLLAATDSANVIDYDYEHEHRRFATEHENAVNEE